jgi:hypothetical protein
MSEFVSYIMTNGQSSSLSQNKAHIWGLQPDFYYCQAVAGLLKWCALSDKEDIAVIYNCCSQGYGGGGPHLKKRIPESR